MKAVIYISFYVVELAVGSEQKLYFVMIPRTQCLLGPSMVPMKTIVIERVRPDIHSVRQACNWVISPGISHVACE